MKSNEKKAVPFRKLIIGNLPLICSWTLAAFMMVLLSIFGSDVDLWPKWVGPSFIVSLILLGLLMFRACFLPKSWRRRL
jgi:hypothetical protein